MSAGSWLLFKSSMVVCYLCCELIWLASVMFPAKLALDLVSEPFFCTFFCTCESVSNTWSWLKSKVMRLGHMGASVDDWDLVNLLYKPSSNDSEIVWLISSYVLYVWEVVHDKKLEVKRDKFFGYLTFKYKMHQTNSPGQLLNLHHIIYS